MTRSAFALLISGGILGVGALLWLVFLPPWGFPVGRVVTIEPGWGLEQVATKLQQERVIASRRFFKILVQQHEAEKKIIAGDYEFEKRLSVNVVTNRLLTGQFAVRPIKITIPEGAENKQIAERLKNSLPDFDEKMFLIFAHSFAGYLFPDTYFFPPHLPPAKIVARLRNNFNLRTTGLQTPPEVIILASLVEREAANDPDRKLIAAILWKRLKAKMPLQVDVAPDTYHFIGLPPEPIANPGLSAIKAVLKPTETANWYYLSDKNGVFHYAKTYEEHQRNIDKYLK